MRRNFSSTLPEELVCSLSWKTLLRFMNMKGIKSYPCQMCIVTAIRHASFSTTISYLPLRLSPVDPAKPHYQRLHLPLRGPVVLKDSSEMAALSLKAERDHQS